MARLLESLRRGLAENARAELLGAQERKRRRQLESALHIGQCGGLRILRFAGLLRHHGFESPRIGSRLPVENDRNGRNKLVQEVEVGHIPGYDAGTDTPRLKIDERIVEVFPLMTRTLRRAAQTKELAREHSRFAPRRRIRSLQAMPRNVLNHLPHGLKNPAR